jgi:hypothetical protein
MLFLLLPKSFLPSSRPTNWRKQHQYWLGKCPLCCFDLETTGSSRQRDEIIELAAVVWSDVEIEDAFFTQSVKPRNPIPPFITELISITNKDVSAAESFPAVGNAFIRFMQQHAEENKNSNEGSPVDNTILIIWVNMELLIGYFKMAGLVWGWTHCMLPAKEFIMTNQELVFHQRTIFPHCYGWCQGHINFILLSYFFIFWDTRSECIFDFSEREPEIHVANRQAQVTANDSDSDSGNSQHSDGESVSSTSSSSEDEESNYVLLGDTWDQGCDFHPAEPHLTERFQEYFTTSLRNGRQRTGLQCSPIDVNTPIRAWREVFKNTLLNNIVRYTHKYELAHAKIVFLLVERQQQFSFW